MPDLSPVTEKDIAEFLIQTPEFFERQADLLASVRLFSPHGGRAVSLQERQAEMLREKIKVLEQRFMELMHHGTDNTILHEKLQNWVRQLLLTPRAAELPEAVLQGLRSEFGVPQAALRLWQLDPAHADQPFAQPVDAEVKKLAESLATPYCGVNSGFAPVQWLDEPEAAASLVLLPLGGKDAIFGLLVLASPDASRYQATMATDLLQRLADLASAALARLRADPDPGSD